MRLIFFGSAPLSTQILEVLAQKHEVVAVVTSPDAMVGRRMELTETAIAKKATSLGIRVFKPRSLKKNELFRDELKALNADGCVLFAYGKIIPQEFLEMTRIGILNIHPSLLPKYRGPSPVTSAVLNGDRETGVSIMLLDNELDHGSILAQEGLIIQDKETADELTLRLISLASTMLLRVLSDLESGTLKGREQDHTNATYTKMVSKDDGRIDWSRTAREIFNQWRAYSSWPGIWTKWKDATIKITDCVLLEGDRVDREPGTILSDGVVVCGDGNGLKIIKLTRSGKSNTGITEFIRGNGTFVGSKFE